MTPEQRLINIEKTHALATALFPHEKWIPHGEGIFIAESRLSGRHKEQAKLFREIADVRILTNRTDGNLKVALPFPQLRLLLVLRRAALFIYTATPCVNLPEGVWPTSCLNGL